MVTVVRGRNVNKEYGFSEVVLTSEMQPSSMRGRVKKKAQVFEMMRKDPSGMLSLSSCWGETYPFLITIEETVRHTLTCYCVRHICYVQEHHT